MSNIIKGAISIKKLKYLIAFIAMLSILITGCSNEVENEEQFIIVQKRIGMENKYDDYREINENEQVQKVLQILSDIQWENAKKEMNRPEDYRFNFKFKNPNIEAKAATYRLWITPYKDKVELILDENNYIKLERNNSAELFEILIGEKLSEQ